MSAVEKLKIVERFLEDGYTLPQLAAQFQVQIKENVLALVLLGHLKNPFYMVGRIGVQNVAIREGKDRISMQVDGVSWPAGNPVKFDLSAKTDLENQRNLEEVNHGKNNSEIDYATDHGAHGKPVRDAPYLFSGKVLGGAGGVDGENKNILRI